MLVVRLFIFFIAWTVVENLLAIPYKVSPFSTVYVDTSGYVFSVTSRTWPICRLLEVKLFKDFSFWTVVENWLAMLYKVSPLFTV